MSLFDGWRSARDAGLPVDRVVIVHDLDRLRRRLAELTAAFPPGTLHAMAIKANPVVGVLRAVVEAGGGLEAASWEEVALARAAGAPAERTVYDSPAKTADELALAVEAGVRLNADSLDELARIDRLAPRAPVGLRINPGVGAGSIAATSVAQRGGRFGVPVDPEDAVVDAFSRYPWLDGLHLHVGSQGCPLGLVVAGAARVAALRRTIDAALGPGRVRWLDLGGGLPHAYRADDPAPSPADWTAALRAAIPDLDRTPLVTEIGRWLHAPCGVAVSRVEYVRPHQDGQLAVIHVGADLLLRRAYQPEHWHHDVVAAGPDGQPLSGDPVPTTVAGPLCFAGDVIARDLPLPPLRAGDRLAIADVGAYTLSMWSRHCSRGIPLVVGIDGGCAVVLRRAETAANVVRFWSDGG